MVFSITGPLPSSSTKWYVSHVTGNDSNTCVSEEFPCKTLRHTVHLAEDGDSIHLDGRESERHPYGYEKAITSPRTLESINKSLAIVGLHQRAHVSCDHGLVFNTPENIKILTVHIENLFFIGTGLRFVGNCTVVIVNSTFAECSPAVKISGTVTKLFLRKSAFTNNTNCVEIYKSNPSAIGNTIVVDIFDVVFKENRIESRKNETEPESAMIFLENHSGVTSVQIRNSLFEENYSSHPPSAFLIRVYTGRLKAGLIRLINSTFSSNPNGIFVKGCWSMSLYSVTFTSTGKALWLRLQSEGIPADIFLADSAFSNISMAFLLALKGQNTNIMVNISNTVIRSTFVSALASIGGIRVQNDKKGLNSSFQMSLKNVTFHAVRGASLYLSFRHGYHFKIDMENCLFLKNEFANYIGRNGGTVYIEWKLPLACNRINSYAHFKNTLFEGNSGYFGIVHVRNVRSTFVNCIFKENYAVSATGGVVCLGEGSGSLNVTNGTFVQHSKSAQKTSWKTNKYTSFIFADSEGDVEVTSSSFTTTETINVYPILNVIKANHVRLDPSASIKCPVGTTLKFHNITSLGNILKWHGGCLERAVAFKVFCEDCPPGTYSLEQGHSTGLVVSKQECQACPYGATCLDNLIKAKPNFWGFVSSKDHPNLTFVPCPLEYCHTPNFSGIHDYNGCYGHRTGELCGGCASGYSEALFSTECREESKCQDKWFWLITAAYTILFALLLITRPPVLSFLWRQTVWFKPLPEPQETRPNPGYLKIVFYFYQVAELLLITAPEDLIHKIRFLSPVVGLFNFQVRSLNENVGCPFLGLTAVTKELFLCLKIFATMGCTVIIFIIHKGISKIGGLNKPSPTLYLAVAMEILLLGYERLAETSLSLLNCVPIGSEWHLFLDGNIRCWQWWQNVLIIYIAIFVAPFIMVLYFGSLRLYGNTVSVKEFLGACVLPLPFLVRWAVLCGKKSSKKENRSLNGEEVKKILHECFRPPTEKDKGTMYWESVLIGRRFVLLCLHSFIADPMVRLLCLDCACVLILVHHFMKRPYHDVKANTCETVSLVALVAIATFSFGEAVLKSAGVEPSGLNENHFQVLQWVEIALLGFLPVAFCVLLTFALLCQMYRLLILLGRRFKTLLYKMFIICEKSAGSSSDEYRPLLDPMSDQNEG